MKEFSGLFVKIHRLESKAVAWSLWARVTSKHSSFGARSEEAASLSRVDYRANEAYGVAGILISFGYFADSF